MNHLPHFVGLTIHLTHHVEQIKKSQNISASLHLQHFEGRLARSRVAGQTVELGRGRASEILQI